MNTIRRINVNMTSVIVDGMYRVQGWQVFLNGDVNYMVNNYAAEPYVVSVKHTAWIPASTVYNSRFEFE